MPKASADPRRSEPDIWRLTQLPAWERAKLYDLANLGLAERSMIEAEVRARIAREFGGAR
jgi:hypothetical protein